MSYPFVRQYRKLVLFGLLGICWACQQNNGHASNSSVDTISQSSKKDTFDNVKLVAKQQVLDSNKLGGVCTNTEPLASLTLKRSQILNHKYPWLPNYTTTNALENQITVPKGFERIKVDGFGAWLRALPLEEKGKPVLLYNGSTKSYQEGAYRVVNIDIGTKDLQQCADAIMRLKAEYHYSKEEYDKIHFNYTSGHTVRFSDWAKGKKPQISGNKVSFSSPTDNTDYSYGNFKKYLNNIFNYAGTASLSKELKKKAISDINIGDVFIWGGFPGHAILVVDVAINPQTNKKIFLLAQSYMPAQSIHILNNFNDESLSPWYSEDFGAQLLTPEWTFERESLCSF